MSSSDKNEMIDTRASEGEIAISKAGSDTGAALALIEMALYPCNDSMAMPELKVTIMWAAETLWEIAYAGTYFQHYLLHTSKARRTQRPVEFVTLPQGNHFVSRRSTMRLAKQGEADRSSFLSSTGIIQKFV